MSHYVYHFDEGVITLPEGFRDASVQLFEWTLPDGRCTLTIQREARTGTSTFEELVAQVTETYPKQFPGFSEEDPMELALDLPATSRRFRWRNEGGVSYHHQVFVDLESTLLLITCSGHARLRDDVDRVLHEALSGLRLRERA